MDTASATVTVRPVWLPTAEIDNHPSQHRTDPNSKTVCLVHLDCFQNGEVAVAHYSPEAGWTVHCHPTTVKVTEFLTYVECAPNGRDL